MSKNRIAKPKYITLKPEIEAMGERLKDKLHLSYSALIARLIFEAHSKVFPNFEETKKELTSAASAGEVDPLS